ncbi:hypothetical protein FLAN108750_04385 [Flavobacterium antarcticum]|uniref:hypothetical protein n=1 Tax=Flavobacterium antarcticum TaxID=271155 RepID=UPI0003B33A49|nr:hypothetical protein [Flavobacterium antarcticum]
MKTTSILFFLFINTFVFAQKSVKIKGTIRVADAKASGVHVINLNTEEEVISDENGGFLIEVHPDDLLLFSADHLDYMRKIIEEDEFASGKISVEMTSKSTVLEEVEIVNYSRINAVDLGILSKPAKKYTVAQRRMYASSSSPVDGLLNLISGRKAVLEDGIAIEKREFALTALDGRYPEKFYTETLKIPVEEIGGFHYFAVEDFKLKEALKGTNSFLVTFIMIKLASDYKAIRDAK